MSNSYVNVFADPGFQSCGNDYPISCLLAWGGYPGNILTKFRKQF